MREPDVATPPPKPEALQSRRRNLAKFKIATPAGASFTVAGGGYDYEMEAAGRHRRRDRRRPADEDGFIAFAQDADAIYAKGMRFTKKVVDGLPAKCRAHRAGQRRRRQRRCRGRHGARHAGDQLPRHLHRGSRRPRDDAAAVDASAAPSSRTAWCAKANGAKAARRCWRSRG